MKGANIAQQLVLGPETNVGETHSATLPVAHSLAFLDALVIPLALHFRFKYRREFWASVTSEIRGQDAVGLLKVVIAQKIVDLRALGLVVVAVHSIECELEERVWVLLVYKVAYAVDTLSKLVNVFRRVAAVETHLVAASTGKQDELDA